MQLAVHETGLTEPLFETEMTLGTHIPCATWINIPKGRTALSPEPSYTHTLLVTIAS